jgi:hypothetical protein
VAYSTLEDIRTDLLNPDLGITDDTAAKPWGDETVRNEAIRDAIRRMWPRMARLLRESVTIQASVVDYALTSIRDLETIEVSDSNGHVRREVRNFRTWVDRSDDPPVGRFLLPVGWKAGTTETIQAIGYAPYAVPSADDDEVDIDPSLLWIVVYGARAYLYRRRFNQWVDYEMFANVNRDNATTPSELFAMYQDSERLYQVGLEENGRDLALARSARLRR